jgi:hypothetical protein
MITKSSHPTTYDLDCYNVQALDAGRQQDVGQHIETCKQCRAYLAELTQERDDLQARLPARPFVREISERAGKPEAPRGFRLPAWAFALGACLVTAVLAFLLWWEPAPRDTIRTMGPLQVSVFVKRGDSVDPVGAFARISEGDSVRIHLVSPRVAFVTVFFMDDSGKISWYLPSSGLDAPLEIPAGETTLPASARFDASPQDERAFVVHATETFVPAEVAGRVQAAWRQSGSSDFANGSWLAGFDNLHSILFMRK